MTDKQIKYLFLLPGIFVILLATIWPIEEAIRVSFMEWKLSISNEPRALWIWSDGFEEISYLFDNFIRSFEDPLARNSAYVTFIFTFFSVAITIIFSMLIALLLFKGGFLRSISRSLLLLPFAMNPALVGISWRFMFNSDFGILSATFAIIFPFMEGVDWLGNETLAMIVLIGCDVWHWSPYMTMLLIGGLSSVPQEIIESAFVDGASSFKTFFTITMPIMLPTIAVATILKAIFSLKMFDQVYMLTKGGPNHSTQTLAHYIYEQGFKYYDMAYASALSYWLVIPLVILAMTYVKLVFKK